MGDKSGIEWTGATWNPVTGCTKVSPGCDHCYAERVTERFQGKGAFATVTLHPERLDLPLRWRKPRKVFVNSMSDLFHDDVPDEFIARVFAVMALAEQHTFQVLTKRHGRMRSLLGSNGFQLAVMKAAVEISDSPCADIYADDDRWPLPNVWLGVSVESQQWADIRIPALLATPAAVRFLSCEPLLGPVYLLTRYDDYLIHGRPVDWVIAGGESGPGARPMQVEWVRILRDQCVRAGIPFHFKQWGEWGIPGWKVGETNGPLVHMGKRNAGRELDGRTWDEYPTAVTA
jgi:protein gp37